MKPEEVIAKAEALGDSGEEIMQMEPRELYDKCLVGIVQRFNHYFLVYSTKCILEVIAEDSDTDDPEYPPDLAAREHFDFNIVGGWLGEGTPAYMLDEEA